MATHAEARAWALEGATDALGREPTLLEVQFLQAVALLESVYGQGWGAAGQGSYNMGAVQAGMPPCNPARSFLYEDSSPQDDGSNVPYAVCFRKYGSPVEGMADVARILYVQDDIKPTSIEAVSRQMYDKHYYEGHGATKDVRIANHVKALTNGLEHITTALDEPMPPMQGEGQGDTGVAMWGLFGLTLTVVGVAIATRKRA